jgi:hypothetical protein
VSIDAVREYVALLWRRYQALKRREDKAQVLDEICRNLGIHRKSALRLMNAAAPPRMGRGPASAPPARGYSEAAKEAVRQLWPKMARIGSKRLKAAFPDWLPHYGDATDAVKAELLRMSASTIERILKPEKAALRRRLNAATRRPKMIVTHVPLRHLGETPKKPGHCEIDTVAHCGGSLSGSYVRTLTVTDIATGWTECEALPDLTGASVRKALAEIEKRLPFKLLALYCDNGAEFLNKDVVDNFARSRAEPIEVFRGRPYRKNDQSYVEQKNWTHVREFFGSPRPFVGAWTRRWHRLASSPGLVPPGQVRDSKRSGLGASRCLGSSMATGPGFV